MKFLIKTAKLLVMMGAVIVLSTLSIDAFDNRENLSGSLLGSAIGFTPKEKSLCPEGMSYVQHPERSFCIDTYTASAGEKCPYLNPSSQSETGENLSSSECKPTSRPSALPWRYITQTQAQDACQRAGKFLPSGKLWFYSARGTPSDPPWSAEDCNLDGNWDEDPGGTGSGSNCVSYSGSFDHVGNVWEWTDGVVRSGEIEGHTLPEPGYITSVDAHGFILSTDPDRPDSNYNGDRLWINPEGTRGVMRGGFFGSGTDGGVYSFHAEMTPDFAGRAVGFRCAAEVVR